MIASAVAIHGHRIVRVDDRDDIADEIGPDTRIVDPGGCALLPGLNDNHTHPLSFGQTLGQIDLGADGEPTGLLRETALKLVRRLHPPPTVDDYVNYLRVAAVRFQAFSITSVGKGGIGDSNQLAAYESLTTAGELPVPVFTMMLNNDTLDPLARLGLRTGLGDE